MHLKRISVLALFCALSVAAGGVAAQKPGGGDYEKRHERRLEKMKRQLELSDEQYIKIKSIHASYEERHQAMKTKIDAARAEVRALMTAENLDRTRIRAGLERTEKLRIDLRMLMLDKRIEMEGVLSSQQKATLREKMKERHQKKKKRRGDCKDKARGPDLSGPDRIEAG